MITYYGDFQFKALDYLIKLLQADTYLQSKVHGRISEQHPSTLDQPVYPMVTVSRIGTGGDASIENIDNAFIVIDVWSKSGTPELWSIYSSRNTTTNLPVGIRALLHNKSFSYLEVDLDKLSEVWVTDNLYEKTTRTWHLNARFVMKNAAKTLVI